MGDWDVGLEHDHSDRVMLRTRVLDVNKTSEGFRGQKIGHRTLRDRVKGYTQSSGKKAGIKNTDCETA